jgi:hypothetical protein
MPAQMPGEATARECLEVLFGFGNLLLGAKEWGAPPLSSRLGLRLLASRLGLMPLVSRLGLRPLASRLCLGPLASRLGLRTLD